MGVMAGLVPAIPIHLHRTACSIGTRTTAESPYASMSLSPGDEVRRKPVADGVGGHLNGAIFRIASCALAGEPLL